MGELVVEHPKKGLVFGFAAVVCAIAIVFCGTAFAKQPDPKLGLIDFYLQAAFANQERVLKRFATKDRFEVNIACSDLGCAEVSRKIRGYLPTRLFDTITGERLNQNSDINILILYPVH